MHIHIYIYILYIYIYYIYVFIYLYAQGSPPPKKKTSNLIPIKATLPIAANFSSSLRLLPCQYKIWRCKWSPLTVPGMNEKWWLRQQGSQSTGKYHYITPLLKTYSFENWWLEDVPFEMVRWHSFIFVGVPLDYRALGLWSLWLEFLFWNGCLSKQTNGRVPPKNKHGVSIKSWQRVISEGEGFICFICPRSVVLKKVLRMISTC